MTKMLVVLLFIFSCVLAAQDVTPVCPGLTPDIPVGGVIGDVQNMATLTAAVQSSNVAGWLTVDNVLAVKWPAVSSGMTVAIFGRGIVPPPGDQDIEGNYPNLVQVLVNGSPVPVIYAGWRLDRLDVIENDEIIVTLPVLSGPTMTIQVKQIPTTGSACFGPAATLNVVQASVVDENGQFVSSIQHSGAELNIQVVGIPDAPSSMVAAVDGKLIDVSVIPGGPGIYKVVWHIPVGLRPNQQHTLAYVGNGKIGVSWTWDFSVLLEAKQR